jgi:hypothetical protein
MPRHPIAQTACAVAWAALTLTLAQAPGAAQARAGATATLPNMLALQRPAHRDRTAHPQNLRGGHRFVLGDGLQPACIGPQPPGRQRRFGPSGQLRGLLQRHDVCRVSSHRLRPVHTRPAPPQPKECGSL